MGQSSSVPGSSNSPYPARSHHHNSRQRSRRQRRGYQQKYPNSQRETPQNYQMALNGTGLDPVGQARRVHQGASRKTTLGVNRSDAVENTVVAHFREKLVKIVALLENRLETFDAQPDEYAPSLEIRELRHSLEKALESYFAAAGSRDTTNIREVMDVRTRVDVRLRSLDEEVHCEVARFEASADLIASRNRVDLSRDSRKHIAADANDLLIELIVYRTSWAPAIQPQSRLRLQAVHQILRQVVESTPPEPWSPPTSTVASANARQIGEIVCNNSSTSSDDGTYDNVLFQRHGEGVSRAALSSPNSPQRSFLRRPARHVASPSRDRIEESRSNFRSSVLQRNSHIPFRQISSSAARKQDQLRSDEQTELSACGLTRNRTLKDIAASMRSNTSQTVEEEAPMSIDSMFPDESSNATTDLSVVNADSRPPPLRSFASMLYVTQNVRSEAVSDSGVSFYQSAVKGDGRCLFRSVARARAVARGRSPPRDPVEREMADSLRASAVEELKRHRELLTQFNVIESDFSRYMRRMSSPRTYGGEPELLMLAKIVHCPIAVYILLNGRYKQIQVYGRQYRGEPIRILYSDGIHYDALLVDSRGTMR